MDKFNNGLSDAQLERLALINEECGEIIQVIGKITRHGFDSYNPFDPNKITNRENLEKEIGDLLLVIDLIKSFDVIDENINLSKARKSKKINKYLHHNVIEEIEL